MKGWIIIAISFAVGVLALVAIFGWSWRSTEPPSEYYLDMKVQPRYRGQSQSKFFADGRAMRMPVPGTVAFGGADYLGSAGTPRLNPDLLQAEDDLYRGKANGKWLTEIPIKFDAKGDIVGASFYIYQVQGANFVLVPGTVSMTATAAATMAATASQ